jgi:hypothetical protein
LALGPTQRCVLLMNPARIPSQFCRAKNGILCLESVCTLKGSDHAHLLLFLRGKKGLCYRVHALAGSGSPCWLFWLQSWIHFRCQIASFCVFSASALRTENSVIIAQPRGKAPSQALINHAAFVFQIIIIKRIMQHFGSPVRDH